MNAAEKRADYVRALRVEREQVERAGKADRIAAIDAELERVSGTPVQRSAPPEATAAAPAPEPEPAPTTEDKPRRGFLGGKRD